MILLSSKELRNSIPPDQPKSKLSRFSHLSSLITLIKLKRTYRSHAVIFFALLTFKYGVIIWQ